MAEATAEAPTIKLTRNQRYHLLNREERLRKQREKYNSDPEVIAKREEKERLRAEKEAEKLAKQQQKQTELQERTKIAAETKRIRKSKVQENS
jgi:hypothetical protein